jgi:hypothetical protein
MFSAAVKSEPLAKQLHIAEHNAPAQSRFIPTGEQKRV